MHFPLIITMGCRINLSERNALPQQIGDVVNLTIVNRCAVTDEAVRQTRQVLRISKKQHLSARISVTDCATQIDAASVKSRARTLRLAVKTQHGKWQKSLISPRQKIVIETIGLPSQTENIAYETFDEIAPADAIVSTKIIAIKDKIMQAELVA